MSPILDPQPAGPADAEQIAALEAHIGHPLPADYRAFLLEHNGGRPELSRCAVITDIGVHDTPVHCLFPSRELALGTVEVNSGEELRTWPVHCAWDDLQHDLREVYQTELEHPLLPIGTDGSGSYYCVTLAGPEAGAVVFLDHETLQVTRLAAGFDAFLAALRPAEEDEVDEEDEDGGEAGLPPPVRAFHAAFRRLVGVSEVYTGLKDLAEYEPRTYSFPGEFGDLPHALLRRTDGGRPDEFWVHTEFQLTKDAAGWAALEFLAWWVRDCSRAGGQLQLRPMALPPLAQTGQFGRTLKFILDQFVPCPGGDRSPALELMAGRASSLNDAVTSYSDQLGEYARPATGAAD